MTCREFLAALDRGASPDLPAMAAHTEECAACREALARSRAARDALRGLAGEEPPPFLHERIMATLRAEQARPARRAPWALRVAWAGPVLVLAFVALLAGHGLLRRPPSPDDGAVPTRASEAAKGAAPALTLEPAAPPTAPTPGAEKKERVATSRRQPGEAAQAPATVRPVAAKAMPGEDRAVPPAVRAIAPAHDGAAVGAAATEEEVPAPAAVPLEAARGGALGSMAARDALGVRAAAAPAEEGERAPGRAWALTEASGGVSRAVPPPPGGALTGLGPWRLDVGPDGRATVTASGPAVVAEAPPAELARWLASLGLAPGTYLLSAPSVP